MRQGQSTQSADTPALVATSSRQNDSHSDVALLSVRDLSVDYNSSRGAVRALQDLSFDLEPGERLGIAGESGSGKSTMGLALMRLLDPKTSTTTGSVRFNGRDLMTADARAMRSVRGSGISMVFQDAMTALDPVRTIGSQIVEGLLAHQKMSRAAAMAQAIELLDEAEIPEPERRVRQYPHELSGGLRQRAMVAVSLSGSPQLLIADEATSALDVTTQAGVLAMLTRLCDRRNMSVIFISHDLGVLAGFTDRVLVLYAGRPMEQGKTNTLFNEPAHPYTRALIASIPRLDEPRLQKLRSIPGNLSSSTYQSPGCPFAPRCQHSANREVCRTELPMIIETAQGTAAACHFPFALGDPGTESGTDDFPEDVAALEEVISPTPMDLPPGSLTQMHDVSKHFMIRQTQGGRRTKLHALHRVSLTIDPSESLGIVGESGSGKTTLGRILVGLLDADSGSVVADNTPGPARAFRRRTKAWRSGNVQMIFQDPGSSLNPLLDVESIVVEPLVITGGGTSRAHRARAAELLELVGLPNDLLRRRAFELSGGQRQRVAIARAICTQPALIVADEAVSSLDMSARGQVLNLLEQLRQDFGIAFVHISHDLSMLRHVADRIVVMYAGEIVEIRGSDELFGAPRHPYTQALISAVPVPDPAQSRAHAAQPLQGDPPSLVDEIVGCPFAPRCPSVQDLCHQVKPTLDPAGDNAAVACHFPLNIGPRARV